MSPARFLVSALVAVTTVLLVAAPSPGAVHIATTVQITTLNEAPMSLQSADAVPERRVNHRERARRELAAAAKAYAEFANVRTNRLRALGYFGDVEGLDYVLPVPPFSYHLSAGFGASGPLWSTTHTGLDFAAPSETSLVAVADGTITDVSMAGPYGLRTILTLEDGTEVWYAHQNESVVLPGQTVEIGHHIGTVGSSGNSTGPHLHLEVRPYGGGPVDPMGWLLERVPVT
jgi:murein DD-endopeptidase MepM/ murein hydrolase activator NlpD